MKKSKSKGDNYVPEKNEINELLNEQVKSDIPKIIQPEIEKPEITFEEFWKNNQEIIRPFCELRGIDPVNCSERTKRSIVKILLK